MSLPHSNKLLLMALEAIPGGQQLIVEWSLNLTLNTSAKATASLMKRQLVYFCSSPKAWPSQGR